MEKLLPNLTLPSIYDLDFAKLRKNGVNTLFFDLDNTLVAETEPLPTEQLKKWLAVVREEGFKLMIISNNEQQRVEVFMKDLNIPYIYKAGKPKVTAIEKGLETVKAIRTEAAMIGDRLGTDIIGGNASGLFTVLVEPVGKDVMKRVRILRKLERFIVKKLTR